MRLINTKDKIFSIEMTDEQEACFWSKVQISDDLLECWEWMGARKEKGYGNVRINKTNYISHRVAFWLANGEFHEKFHVCHSCDNPSCCNPSHLMLGTPISNYMDMLIKNRQEFYKNKAFGERNSQAKLNAKMVEEIRALYSAKIMNQYELADMYGVSQNSIGSIVRHKTWRHV